MTIPLTLTIELRRFSFNGPDGDVSKGSVFKDQFEAFHGHLNKHYNVIVVDSSESYVILLECEGNIPAEDERLSSIAGCITVWNIDQASFALRFNNGSLPDVPR
ncbi:hypothetical protein F4861DRAFT_20504 [Xylaria intraflava]|nr:hypothetical protein F4861DRAFT_20504 [Xylaria intraflava]